VPGAAVALVQGDEVVFVRGFGVRDPATGAPVGPRTRFRIGSVTKSVTALVLAALADDGALAWDDRVADLWPAFRAPTPELTASLRLRDLLGMGSGIAESADLPLPVVEFFMMAGEVSAQDALRRVADLPVVGPPGVTYSYNNTLVAAAAFVGLLAAGVPEDGLEAAYSAAARERVFAPLGMAGAAIAEDPRPLGTTTRSASRRTSSGPLAAAVRPPRRGRPGRLRPRRTPRTSAATWSP
jgi:CubicO group peptidase (beta-lactamase class C family)